MNDEYELFAEALLETRGIDIKDANHDLKVFVDRFWSEKFKIFQCGIRKIQELVAKYNELEAMLKTNILHVRITELEDKLAEADRKYTEDITHLDEKLKIAVEALRVIGCGFHDNKKVAVDALEKIKE